MYLSKLAIYGLRNIAALELLFSQKANFIFGLNGAGKTSLLEAIFLLANGKSFRGGYRQSLIMDGKTGFRIGGRFINTQGLVDNITITREGRERRLAVNSVPVQNRSELVRRIPLLLFSQETLTRQIDSAAGRRNLLDWCLFHVEPSYHSQLQNYRSVVAQYNASLRRGINDRKEWMIQLAEAGEQINNFRQGIVKKIQAVFTRISKELPDLPGAYLDYRQGWVEGAALLEALASRSDGDVGLGYCTSGPHRSDLRVRSARGQILHWASRGQVKAYYYLLFIALLAVVAEETGEPPIALIDDLWAEFDESVANCMVGITAVLGGQVVYTGSKPAADLVDEYNMASFHVEHGLVIEAKTGQGG